MVHFIDLVRFFSLSHCNCQQAEHFCNSIGCLQEQSRPSKFPGFERIGTQSQNECEVDKYPEHFAQEISV